MQSSNQIKQSVASSEHIDHIVERIRRFTSMKIDQLTPRDAYQLGFNIGREQGMSWKGGDDIILKSAALFVGMLEFTTSASSLAVFVDLGNHAGFLQDYIGGSWKDFWIDILPALETGNFVAMRTHFMKLLGKWIGNLESASDAKWVFDAANARKIDLSELAECANDIMIRHIKEVQKCHKRLFIKS